MTDEVERHTPGGTARAKISDDRAADGRASADHAADGDASHGRPGEGWSGVAADVPLHPIAEALRKTFHADNHATLGRDVTGLMLDLSRVPFEPYEFEPIAPQLQPPPRAPEAAGWLAWARLAVRRMRSARS